MVEGARLESVCALTRTESVRQNGSTAVLDSLLPAGGVAGATHPSLSLHQLLFLEKFLL